VSPDPKPEDQQQQARAVPKPRVKPTPPKKVEKQKKQDEFKLDDIAALLNKTDEEKAAPSDQTETGTPLVGNQNLTGNDEQVTATALDWLRQRVGTCWSIPAGARDAGKLVVTLRFQLDIDGAHRRPALRRAHDQPSGCCGSCKFCHGGIDPVPAIRQNAQGNPPLVG
jgi:colicin import membrane protein